MLLFTVAQLVLAFTPLVEARLGASAGAHVEEAGTGLHHAHDEANCVACIARSLLGSAELAPRGTDRVPDPALGLLTATAAAGGSTLPSQSRPRAPPATAS